MQQPSLSSDQRTGSTNVLAPQTATEQKETTPAPTPVPSLSSAVPQAEDLYDFDTCTIVAVVQLRPRKEAHHARQVLLSVQNGTTNKEDVPLYRLLTEDELGGPFPPALTALFEELTRQLPERKQRHEQRMQTKVSSAASSSRMLQKTSSKEKSSQKKSSVASGSAKPVPPVPTTPTDPHHDLVFDGFDWFGTELTSVE